MAPHSSTLAWKISSHGGAWWAAVHGVSKSQTRLIDFTFTHWSHASEKEMATHSSVIAWRIPGTVKPGGLSMGSHRVGHDWSDLAAAAEYNRSLYFWLRNVLKMNNCVNKGLNFFMIEGRCSILRCFQHWMWDKVLLKDVLLKDGVKIENFYNQLLDPSS